MAMSEIAQSCHVQPRADGKSFHRNIHNRATPLDSPKRPAQLDFRMPYLLMVTTA
jgi:hypothetical protein